MGESKTENCLQQSLKACCSTKTLYYFFLVFKKWSLFQRFHEKFKIESYAEIWNSVASIFFSKKDQVTFF